MIGYLVQAYPDGRIVIQDSKNSQHKYINTPNNMQTFSNLEDCIDWLIKNSERLPWVPNRNQYGSHANTRTRQEEGGIVVNLRKEE